MGGSTQLKKAKELEEKQKLLNAFALKSRVLKAVSKEESPPLVIELENYREYFIRNENTFTLKTKSSNRSKQLLELVRHVFHKFPVPSFMEQVWELGKMKSNTMYAVNDPKIDFRKWYICIATGGSLYKEYAKDIVTKKELHVFLTCRHNLSIIQTLVFAVGKMAGAKEGDALRVAQSKLSEKPLNEFWKHAIRFFSLNCPATINHINDLVDYLAFKYNENNKFSLAGSGMSLTTLDKKMHDWHYDLRRMKAIGNEKWEGHPIPDKSYEKKNKDGYTITWIFKQIKSAKELQEEGNKQRHCVFGYKKGCIDGNHSIWSLSLNEYEHVQKKITIELRNNGYIAQARGLANRSPRSEELDMIKVWANENGLKFNNYY